MGIHHKFTMPSAFGGLSISMSEGFVLTVGIGLMMQVAPISNVLLSAMYITFVLFSTVAHGNCCGTYREKHVAHHDPSKMESNYSTWLSGDLWDHLMGTYNQNRSSVKYRTKPGCFCRKRFKEPD